MNLEKIEDILLSNNRNVSGRTKHINAHHNFFMTYIEDGIVNIEFVHSEDNFTDILPKNYL